MSSTAKGFEKELLSNSKPRPNSEFSLPFIGEDNENFLKDSKRKIINAIDSARREIKQLFNGSDSKPCTTETSPALNKKRYSSFEHIQKKNLRKIRQTQKQLEVEETEKMFRLPRELNKNSENSGRKSASHQSSSRFEEVRAFLIVRDHEEVSYADTVLEKVNKKLQKSAENHYHSINIKKRLALKQWERAQSVNQGNLVDGSSVNRILKIISKNNQLETWKKRYLQAKSYKIQRNREQQEVKANKAKETLNAIEKTENLKSQQIEKKMKTHNSIIIHKKKSIEKLSKERHAKSQLKAIDVSNKLRQNLINQKSKNEALLEKILMENEKLVKTKQEKELKNFKIRENSIKAMIKKEKVQDTLLKIKHSLNLSFLEEKYKEFSAV